MLCWNPISNNKGIFMKFNKVFGKIGFLDIDMIFLIYTIFLTWGFSLPIIIILLIGNNFSSTAVFFIFLSNVSALLSLCVGMVYKYVLFNFVQSKNNCLFMFKSLTSILRSLTWVLLLNTVIIPMDMYARVDSSIHGISKIILVTAQLLVIGKCSLTLISNIAKEGKNARMVL
jgi:hypothetical protein